MVDIIVARGGAEGALFRAADSRSSERLAGFFDRRIFWCVVLLPIGFEFFPLFVKLLVDSFAERRHESLGDALQTTSNEAFRQQRGVPLRLRITHNVVEPALKHVFTGRHGKT